MSDEMLKVKIKKLAGVMETNEILDPELQGGMKTKVHRDVFIKALKHHVLPKKKFTGVQSIDKALTFHEKKNKQLMKMVMEKSLKGGGY